MRRRTYDEWIQQCARVVHIKPFFVPVDIRHNQCPCRFFNPREIQALWSLNYATQILHCYVWSKHSSSRQCNAMSSYWVWQHDIHILRKRENERGQRKTETKKKKKTKSNGRKERRKRKELLCLPAGDVTRHLKKSALEKKKKTPLYL